MTCHDTSTGRTCSTSSIQREVIQAHGHSGSNQKSARARSSLLCVIASPCRSHPGAGTASGGNDARMRGHSRCPDVPGRGAPGVPGVQGARSVRVSNHPTFPSKEPCRKVPGTNLTREEAAERARLVSVSTYQVELDLTTGAETFESTSV